ncbi:MAG: hypothetical protein ACTHMM_10135 [Agriterribacter sp.]
MKKIITILFLFSVVYGQDKTFKRFGSGGWDLNGFYERWMNGSDSLFTIRTNNIKFFKPVRPGAYTTSNAPSAAAWTGYIIYNTDSSVHQYSNGSNWINMVGNNSVTLPTIPNNYALIRSGTTYDSSIMLYVSRAAKKIGIGTASPTHALTLDSIASFNSGIALHRFTDQTTNYFYGNIFPSSSNAFVYNVAYGGTQNTGFHDFRVNGTSKMTVDANNLILTGGFLSGADNIYDFGRLSASPFRVRDFYLGRSLQVGTAANTAITGRIHLGPVTSTVPQLYFEDGATNVSSPSNGMLWRNGNSLYYRNNGTTVDLLAAPFSLTTTGTSGAATYTGGVLNIPQYTGGGGGGSVAGSDRQIQFNSAGNFAANDSVKWTAAALTILGQLRQTGDYDLRIGRATNNAFYGLRIDNSSGSEFAGLKANASTGEVRLTMLSSYFPTFYSSGAEAGRINTSGYWGLKGITSPAAFLHVPASTTAAASITIPSGTAPTSPNNGDVWHASSHLYVRLGGSTYQLDQQSGGATSAAGTWTPTLTGSSNYSSGTVRHCTYQRMDNIVTISGYIDVIPTAATTTIFEITLPVASDFNTGYDAHGTLNIDGAAAQWYGGYVGTNTTDNRIVLGFAAGDTGSQAVQFTIQYEIK